MKSKKIWMRPIIALSMLWSTAALAIPISFETQGAGAITYFSGLTQESVLTYGGNTGTVNVNYGVASNHRTHSVLFNTGTHDGALFGPIETYVIETIFTIGGISQVLTQQGRYQQIANGQFMFSLFDSNQLTFDLGSLGILNITGQDALTQLVDNPTGQRGLLQSRFELSPPTAQVYEPPVILLFAIGLLAIMGRRASLWRRM